MTKLGQKVIHVEDAKLPVDDPATRANDGERTHNLLAAIKYVAPVVQMGIARHRVEQSFRAVRLEERQRAAQIALSIDSGRGNEKQIAHAILNPPEPKTFSPPEVRHFLVIGPRSAKLGCGANLTAYYPNDELALLREGSTTFHDEKVSATMDPSSVKGCVRCAEAAQVYLEAYLTRVAPSTYNPGRKGDESK